MQMKSELVPYYFHIVLVQIFSFVLLKYPKCNFVSHMCFSSHKINLFLREKLINSCSVQNTYTITILFNSIVKLDLFKKKLVHILEFMYKD